MAKSALNSTATTPSPGATPQPGGAGTPAPPSAGAGSRPEQLTANFTLAELTDSDRATRAGIDNTPGDDQIPNAVRLARDVLQPIRDRFGPIRVTSGFRCEELNRRVNGEQYSAHLWPVFRQHGAITGRKAAADIQPVTADIGEVFDWIRFHSGLPIDQVILERGRQARHSFDDVIHVAWSTEPRYQALIGQTYGRGSYQSVDFRLPPGAEEPA